MSIAYFEHGTIECFANDAGVLEKPVTVYDICQHLRTIYRLNAHYRSVIISDYQDQITELGLYNIKVEGIAEPFKLWIVPKPD